MCTGVPYSSRLCVYVYRCTLYLKAVCICVQVYPISQGCVYMCTGVPYSSRLCVYVYRCTLYLKAVCICVQVYPISHGCVYMCTGVPYSLSLIHISEPTRLLS